VFTFHVPLANLADVVTYPGLHHLSRREREGRGWGREGGGRGEGRRVMEGGGRGEGWKVGGWEGGRVGGMKGGNLINRVKDNLSC